MAWQRASRNLSRTWAGLRRFSTTVARHDVADEGDWSYSSEWWGAGSDGHAVFRSTSDKGNGVVSVLAFPSSEPGEIYWPETEKWLQQRYSELHPSQERDIRFRILGYQWRTLHFNEETRQSTVKVMAAYKESEPGSIFLAQQANCLAVPYLRSMVSVGLAAVASCKYDLLDAACGRKTMRILCIGHGGGSLPLFLARNIEGAIVDIVEIDPLVISASVQVMGFPAFPVMTSSGQNAISKPNKIDEVLWKGIHERLYLYESDAENFVTNTSNVYDMIFIDAYDGDDIFHRKLWDPDSPFLKALSNQLHPGHGTVVVNLHTDSDAFAPPNPSLSLFYEQLLPMSKHVSKVCQAYKDTLVGRECSGLAFTVSVPWVCNTSMVVCRGFESGSHYGRDSIVNALISKSLEVDSLLNLPFSCLQYIKRDFTLVD